MGRTPKPLTILVHDDLWGPAFEHLRAQGHQVWSFSKFDTVSVPPSLADFDLILGPNAQLATQDHLIYLNDMLKRARKKRYGRATDE